MPIKCKAAALTLSLLLLAGCSAGQTPSPSETPTPSQTPAPVGSSSPVPEGAYGDVMAYVDRVLEGEEVYLQCWLSNGSGPMPLHMEAYKAQVREVFARREWTALEEKGVQRDWTPADWSIYLNAKSDLSVNLCAGTTMDYLIVMRSGSEGSTELYYTAGDVSSIPLELAQLDPGPGARLCLAEVPAESVTNDQELAEAYAAALGELYLASGHITDFEVTYLEPVYFEGGESIYHHIRMAFSVTPADPADPYWQTRAPLGGDGRYYSDQLLLTMLLDEDNIWRCDWIQ